MRRRARFIASWGIPALALFACGNEPPPIGSDDAATDTNGGDVSQTQKDAAEEAATDATGDSAEDVTTTCTTLASPPSDPTCASCVVSTCCSAWNECQGNSDCVGYVACAQACVADGGTADAGLDADDDGPPVLDDSGTDHPNCFAQCQTAYPNGINDGIVIADCLDNGCAGKCD